ncbi:MAG: hypothetical protein BGO49_22935 [Planctomycetales bacterium 71-10]|nr:MAG: hypothetical protein BGO49_22935 [Planctomycetales bacterium 71-10]
MILAMLLDTARAVRRHQSGLCLLALMACAAPARAQSAGGGYLPSGAGTFVPYRGDSLGVMPSGPLGPATTLTVPSRPMGRMPGSAALGLRDGVNALQPIGPRGGMASSPMVGRPAMKPMPRRPVGSYPFRIPPSLRGGPAQRPAMAM